MKFTWQSSLQELFHNSVACIFEDFAKLTWSSHDAIIGSIEDELFTRNVFFDKDKARFVCFAVILKTILARFNQKVVQIAIS